MVCFYAGHFRCFNHFPRTDDAKGIVELLADFILAAFPPVGNEAGCLHSKAPGEIGEEITPFIVGMRSRIQEGHSGLKWFEGTPKVWILIFAGQRIHRKDE